MDDCEGEEDGWIVRGGNGWIVGVGEEEGRRVDMGVEEVGCIDMVSRGKADGLTWGWGKWMDWHKERGDGGWIVGEGEEEGLTWQWRKVAGLTRRAGGRQMDSGVEGSGWVGRGKMDGLLGRRGGWIDKWPQ